MLVSKDAKICVTSKANPQCDLYSTCSQTPNANRWNIGRVGFPMQNSQISHVDFMFFVLISFPFVTKHEPSLFFSGIWAQYVTSSAILDLINMYFDSSMTIIC